MYVRPETLTLLYLSIFLAVITRWDRHPRLALSAAVVQVAWVNSHGLFVLGPIILVFGLIDAALRGGIFAPERRQWWRTILAASLATGLACLINPYGITGALYPIELAGTMSNPIFSRAYRGADADSRASSGPGGLWNLPLQLHLATMVLGALSFLVPLSWLVGVRLAGPRAAAQVAGCRRSRAGRPANRPARARSGLGRGQSRATTASQVVRDGRGGRSSVRAGGSAHSGSCSIAAFCHPELPGNAEQPPVRGGGRHGDGLEFRRMGRGRPAAQAADESGAGPASGRISPRLVAFGAVVLVLLWVGSGQFYRMTGEGRTIGLGEEPLWFPHEAARFAGQPEMPERFLSFHNGHASLFEYYHGPERKVYTDPRLEVAGADLFTRYTDLGRRESRRISPGGRPSSTRSGARSSWPTTNTTRTIGATLLRERPLALRLVRRDRRGVRPRLVRSKWSGRMPSISRPGISGRIHRSESRSDRRADGFAQGVPQVRDGARPPGASWPVRSSGSAWTTPGASCEPRPTRSTAGKILGQIELFRELPPQPIARFRAPFDPVFDLSIVRATYAFGAPWSWLRATS